VGTMTDLWNAMRRRRALVIVVGVVLAVGLGTSAAIVGQHFYTTTHSSKTTNTANATDKTDASSRIKPAGFTDFRTDQGGFELAYPANWTKLSPKDPSVLLLLSQGTQDSLLVRANELQEPVGPQQLPAAKQATDKLVANSSISMVTDAKQIELGGLPGLLYLYDFKDPATGLEGSHYHYFLFNGKTMITMVFQTMPKERFAESAKTFDQITGSFHTLKK
jgi:hypothetical protein